MVTDQIADLLTRIRNAQSAGHLSVKSPASRSKGRVLEVLKDEGFLTSFEEAVDENSKPIFKIQLKYDTHGDPIIREVKRISSPGCRVYVGKEDIPYHKGGLGLVLVSTSKGMLSDRAARREGIGGELVCSVF